MVGEVCDGETAESAVRSALVGGLLLSTLHTNDATGAVSRLLDMGVEPFLLASTLSLVIAQRLVRRLCVSCRGSVPTDIRAEAVAAGMKTMFQDGLAKVFFGEIALEEILRVAL